MRPKMIGFRVDANERIATGHLMRCIAIAEACMEFGEECVFFLAEDKETQRLSEKKLPYFVLDSSWNHMYEEKEKLGKLLRKIKVDWLVIDSYQVTMPYLEYIQKIVPVFYIDDMAKERYPVSAVLHYVGLKSEKSYYDMYAESKAQLLLGTKFVPLRTEFRAKTTDEEREKRILITTGGTDVYNVTGQFLRELQKNEKYDEYVVHAIVGSMNQHKQELEELEKSDTRVRLHYNVKNMAHFMRISECAVSAGGTTLYELCACKTPTVCFSFADNQQPFTKEMEKMEIMLYAGDAREDTNIGKTIIEKLGVFLDNSILKQDYAARMGQLVDGKGCERIARFLTGI